MVLGFGDGTATSAEADRPQAGANLQAVLEDAGLSMDDVVKCNVYLTDMADFPAMNVAYAEHFAEPFPARTTIGVAARSSAFAAAIRAR